MNYLAAAVGAALYFLGFVGFGIWPLAFIALIPLWWALERTLNARARTTFAVSWLYGTITYVGGYHWLVSMLEVFSGYGLVPSTLFTVIFCGYLGLCFAIYGLLYRLCRKRGMSIALSAVPTLVLVETFFPHLFPSYLANSVHQQTYFVQIVELGGPPLLSAVIALVSVALFELLRFFRSERNRPVAPLAAAVVCVVATLLYGTIRIPQIQARMDSAPKLQVGLVQVNMGIFEKREDAAEGIRRHIAQTEQLHQEHEIDLVIWPESAYIRRLPRGLPFDGRRIAGEVKAPVLFGGLSVEYPQGKRRVYNTAFLVDRDQQVRSLYDKTFLLMFGEYLPFGEQLPWLYKLSPNSGKFSPGSQLKPLTFDDWRVSVPICYEDVLPAFTRKMVAAGDPHLIVNITNDAWFGKTQEPWIHLALAQYRAIEHRRFVVRSTNSGVSAFIDPIGQVRRHTGLHTQENLVDEVAMLRGRTLYGRFGEWPGWLSLAFIVIAMWRARKVRPSTATSAATD